VTPRRSTGTRRLATIGITGVAAIAAVGVGLSQANAGAGGGGGGGSATATPIKHLVVIFQENVSFDHYFATYPQAANPSGEPRFTAAADTPSVNGLNTPLNDPNNPNSTQPFRLDRSQAETCDQDHTYTDEQRAYDHGLMDRFPETVGQADSTAFPCVDYGKGKGLVMGYYDGNTVTALWNYAQNYAMSDNSFDTTFGPSTPGALNLASGQTHGFAPDFNPFTGTTGTAVTPNQTVIGDPQPQGDICDTRDQTTSIDNRNQNIGDLLNSKGVTWGWFQGGFRNCTDSHTNVGGQTSKDYIPHHEPFQYYASTANPQHTPPASVAEIGHNGPANHQYDLTDWQAALSHANLPSVSFLKAPAYQDGHAGYSDPLDEQTFLVNTINTVERSQYWKDTAVVVAYDDSDGWYDHQMGPIVNQSQDATVDALRGSDCGTNVNATLGGYQDRCGYGPRLPLLVISPFARTNFVDHSTTDQTSVLRFVEDNWNTGRIGNASFDAKAGSLANLFDFQHSTGAGSRTLLLDPSTGQPQRGNGH
jgi:phospholipase C